MKLEGYGAVFGSPSTDMGFLEYVDPGAFTETLRTANVRGLFNHNPDYVLGTTDAGTMRLSVDSVGLRYSIDVNPDDPMALAVAAKVATGSVNGSSFSFTVLDQRWDYSASPPVRWLLQVALVDVGPVAFPAYPGATANVRGSRSILVPGQELRVGKTLSAASKSKIQAAMNELQALLEMAGPATETPDTEPIGETDNLINVALEEDSISAALEKDSLIDVALEKDGLARSAIGSVAAGQAVLARWQRQLNRERQVAALAAQAEIERDLFRRTGDVSVITPLRALTGH